MSLFALMFVIVVVGMSLWALNKFVPMAPPVKNLLNIAVVLFLVIWCANAFGLFSELSRIRLR